MAVVEERDLLYQIIFPDGETFKHFNLKWTLSTVRTKLVDDPILSDKLKEIGLAAFKHLLGGIGYASLFLLCFAHALEAMDDQIFESVPRPGRFISLKSILTVACFILTETARPTSL